MCIYVGIKTKAPRTKTPLGQKLRQKAPNNDEKKMFLFIHFFYIDGDISKYKGKQIKN